MPGGERAMLRGEAGQSLWSHPRGGARVADLRQPNPLTPYTAMTVHQRTLHAHLEQMFGRTPEWRTLHAAQPSCATLSPERAYIHLSALFATFQGWRFTRLPRRAGIPQDPDERRTAYYRALEEERHARALIPERDEPIPDSRPAATAAFAPYLELNPELEEALAIDYPGLSRRRSASPV